MVVEDIMNIIFEPKGDSEMFYKLRVQILVTFILLLIVPLLVSSVVILQVSNAVIGESTIQSLSQSVDQYAAFVDTITLQVEDVANQVLSNEVTQKWITAHMKGDLTTEERLQLAAEMRKYLSSVALNNSAVASITIFDNEGNATGIGDRVFRDTSYKDNGWYLAFTQKGDRWVNAHQDRFQPEYLQDEQVNSLLFPMTHLRTFINFGVLKVNFESSLLEEQIDRIRFGETSRLYILDHEGKPVIQQEAWYNSENMFAGDYWEQIWQSNQMGGHITATRNAEEYTIFYRKLNRTEWVLIGEIPAREMFQKLANVQNTILWISGLLLVITVFAAYWLSSGIAKPLSALVAAMRYAERGDFTKAETAAAVPPVIKNEVVFATKVFHNLVKRLRYLIETEYQSNMRRRDAEFKALLMQINPHFLYNTLEVIGSLSIQGRNMEVLDVTESLGLMLRFSLKLDSDIVKLGDELQYIRYYVYIMKARFNDRINVDIEEDQGASKFSVIKFILQPLVENAIKYSLESKELARVRITATLMNGSTLEITVEDNGKGMPSELIQELLQESSSKASNVLNTPGRRIGLRNVLLRCRLFYNEGFSVEIQSKPEIGTSIRLLIACAEGER